MEPESPTGDDPSFLQRGVSSSSEDEDYRDLEREWDQSDDDYIRARDAEDQRSSGGSQSEYQPGESEIQTQPSHKERDPTVMKKEDEWFNFRIDTADLPNLIAGISKAQAFERGWSS